MLRWRAAVAAAVLVSIVVAFTAAVPSPVAAHEDNEEGGPPVFLVHGMPDAVFEVQVGDDRRLKGLRFGQFYNLRAFAGTTLDFGFRMLETGEPVVATDGYAVPTDRSSSLVVHHGSDGSAALTAFENKLDPLEPGVSRLVVRHLAAAPPFDVLIDGELVLPGIEHGWEESIDRPAGDVAVTLVPVDRDVAPVGPVDVALTPGDRLIVYGFGSAENGTLATVTDVVHGVDSGAGIGDGLPLRAMAVSTALALVIGVFGLRRIRHRSRTLPRMRA